ncbi:hypothetical protein [Pseudonocardia acidicola]|uniref:Uncharacterized protein n=1 Tax=Pseudonocardia acidicola TaxID=2724939 RepID=A0ABX1S523_9PSEU|nr:hypothetical protein [Pseudonocardia acidicola]NMH96195.1 hypothetical protein [Pseudonocardia acidicola]
MGFAVVVGLVLLPVVLYALALALAACRDRIGRGGLPRARCVARSVRLMVAGDPLDPPHPADLARGTSMHPRPRGRGPAS